MIKKGQTAILVTNSSLKEWKLCHL